MKRAMAVVALRLASVAGAVHLGLLRVSKALTAKEETLKEVLDRVTAEIQADTEAATVRVRAALPEDWTTKSHSSWVRAVSASIPAGGLTVAVGSRVTCSPPPTDTDEDYLVLVKDIQQARRSLIELGFEEPKTKKQIEEYEEMNKSSQYSFQSLRLGDVNYIVTDSPFFFERFLTASYVAKRLNLLNKEDRIMIFNAIRGGSYAKDFFPEWDQNMGSTAGEAYRIIRALETEAHLAENVVNSMSRDTPF